MQDKRYYLFPILACLIVLATAMYYPKWTKPGTEATISWDVSGYYMYLPAIFIYKDIRQCSFQEGVLNKYNPSPDFQQAFLHSSGNYVMKYPIGQAIMFSPFFTLAHIYASISDKYEADGFSYPYQLMIGFGGLLVSCIGLFFLFRILCVYFRPQVAGWTVIGLLLGSNLLEYASITNAMTHNYLFTIYTILIFLTIRFYRRPTYFSAILIGSIVGLATITRPTEILIACIPVIWGIDFFRTGAWRDRINFLIKHRSKIGLALLFCVLVGFIQLSYWKFASGEWLVYSYQDQGFSWLSPHIEQGMFGFKSGWLVYSPFMVFSLLGFYYLFKFQRTIFGGVLVYSILFMYVTFAWDIWWYGGSLGQRAMVQCYPVLAFALAAFIHGMYSFNRIISGLILLIMAGCVYLNLWFTYQAHKPFGLLHAGHMTRAYYMRVVGRYDYNLDNLKLLDTKEDYRGQVKNVATLYFNDFESDDGDWDCPIEPVSGNSAWCIGAETTYTDPILIPFERGDYDWIRVSADYRINQKEWNIWSMIILYANLLDEGKVVKTNALRVQRVMVDGETKRIHLDLKLPHQNFDSITFQYHNPGSAHFLLVDNLKVEAFEAED